MSNITNELDFITGVMIVALSVIAVIVGSWGLLAVSCVGSFIWAAIFLS